MVVGVTQVLANPDSIPAVDLNCVQSARCEVCEGVREGGRPCGRGRKGELLGNRCHGFPISVGLGKLDAVTGDC